MPSISILYTGKFYQKSTTFLTFTTDTTKSEKCLPKSALSLRRTKVTGHPYINPNFIEYHIIRQKLI